MLHRRVPLPQQLGGPIVTTVERVAIIVCPGCHQPQQVRIKQTAFGDLIRDCTLCGHQLYLDPPDRIPA